ncbi:hypothetical protein F5B19DRAFT_490585 [Rostrohypoxylon terebratum]|nr:hypothetical protein F5B19DRAFT_490585 [Rostrohypoxylon terebratum]
MSNSPTSSFRQDTPSRISKSPPKKSSYSPVCCEPKREEDYSRVSHIGRRPPSNETGCLTRPPTLDSPIPRPKSAPGVLPDARGSVASSPAIPLPTSYLLRRSKSLTCYPCMEQQQVQGHSRTLLPKLKSTVEAAEDFRFEDEDNKWVDVDGQDEGWFIVNEPVDYFDMDKALDEPIVKSISITIDNEANAEQSNLCLRVHPLFKARYGDDPDWGSMAELDEYQRRSRV